MEAWKIAQTLAPLHALSASVPLPKSPLLWDPDALQAFHDAKAALASAVPSDHPDLSAALALTTDASLVAVGAVLTHADFQGAPLAFFSKIVHGVDGP